MAEMTLLQAINTGLFEQMRKDKTVVVFGEDAGFEGGVFRVTKGLQEEFGELRCFDTPISEAGIVGSAIGMAINGLKPVAEMQFDGFMFNGYNQLTVHAARMRNRSRSRFTVPMVLRVPMGGGIRALEHHSEAIEALFTHIPGLKVVYPSTPYDAKGLLASAIQDPDPVIYLEPKKIYRAFKQDVPENEYLVPIGKAKVFYAAKDANLTVVSWGAMVHDAVKAVRALEAEGVRAEVIDLRTLSPIDYPTVYESVRRTGRLVVVSEAVKSFGVASEIITRVTENCFLNLEAPPVRVTGWDITVPLARGEYHHMPDVKRISYDIKNLMAFKL
jgi:pyruvate dehydrogenase E1 component beta subunit